MGVMQERFKLEIYCATKEDMKLILEIIERFAMFAPEYDLEQIEGIGVMKVEHHHYVLKRRI